MLHKTETNSRIKDDAPAGKRTAVCGEIVDAIDVNNMWKKVTCKNCLKWSTKKSGIRINSETRCKRKRTWT